LILTRNRQRADARQKHAQLGQFGRLILAAATIYPLFLLILSALHYLAPQRQGLLVLSQIFALYLFIPLVLILPLALLRQANVLRWVLLACIVVAGLRFGPIFVSLPQRATPGAATLDALSWNLYLDNTDFATIRSTLRSSNAQIVALQELTLAQHAAITADDELRQRFAWQYHVPASADGMGLLSSYPIIAQGRLDNPQHPTAFPILWAKLDLGQGRTLTVVNAHPRPARIRLERAEIIRHGFDPTIRDEEIGFLRAFIEPLLEQNEPVLVLGDFNLTEREPVYADLTVGLQDAHALVGWGSGHSWRPGTYMQWPLAALRIDYLLSSSQLRPLRTTTDCTPRGSDHCMVDGTFELEPN